MKTTGKKLLCALCAVVLLFGLGAPALAANSVETAMEKTEAYLYEKVTTASAGGTDSDWSLLGLARSDAATIGLARSGLPVPEEYFQKYYSALESFVKANNGVLSAKKYTEYSRVILAIAALGKDPTSVAGYNLLTPLGDYEKTVSQGINGPIWALMALDSATYAVPTAADGATQATRRAYVQELLRRQLDCGGWNLSGEGGSGTADADITAMTLQALAKYKSFSGVPAAIDKGLLWLSEAQDAKGGYASYGTTNCESTAQVIMALCELKISLTDSRFVKNGITLLDNLLSYAKEDGSFSHTLGGSTNQMATEQAFCALVAAYRAENGKNTLYRMADAEKIGDAPGVGDGLYGKNADVKAMPVLYENLTFDDIADSASQTAIEALCSRGIINGMGNNLFAPTAEMTRAQFAAIVTRGLGLEAKAISVFSDVPANAWYAGYIGTAYTYGLINGVGDNKFDPEGSITREQAATLISRAAKLCGMEISMTETAIRDSLAPFSDYKTVSDYALSPLAFCYQSGILASDALTIQPKTPILRGEIAQMLYNMLAKANLL